MCGGSEDVQLQEVKMPITQLRDVEDTGIGVEVRVYWRKAVDWN
jgi:uncharacterized OB-fold protein